MIKAVLLDDEPLALRQLELYASKTEGMEVLAACTSASAALPFLERADVLFVDINMPDVNGLDLVRSLVHPPLVVFTTAYAEYAVEGFRVQAVDYLLKPFGQDEFSRAVARVRHILEVEQAARQSEPGVLHVKTDYKTVNVPWDSIRYIESMSEYVKIWLDTQETPLVVRIHRSYIVNLSRIRSANATSLEVDGVVFPVGESYRAAFRAWLQSES